MHRLRLLLEHVQPAHPRRFSQRAVLVQPALDHRSVNRNQALGTGQFYLMWSILFINVSAGIGILSQASPMTQDMFRKSAVEAAAVVSLISLFNLAGRFFWASTSDYIGRRNTYLVFFLVQPILFLAIPGFATVGRTRCFSRVGPSSTPCTAADSPLSPRF